MKNIVVLLAMGLLWLAGCTSDNDRMGNRVPVVRLDRILASYAGCDSVRQVVVLDSVRIEADAMFAVLGIDSVTPSLLDSWSRSRVVEVFQPAVDSVYPNINEVAANLGYIMEAARRELPDLPHFTFASVVWGNPRPVVRVDSVILIALNHFLGPEYPGYASWPEYRRVNKTPRQLPYAVAAAITATQYPMEMGDEATLLNWMLYEGALVEARMRLVPDARLDEALGYSPEELKFAEDNIAAIWQEMSIQRMIYDTDPLNIDRMVSASPSSPVLMSKAPGRIGAYVGYRIVKAYLTKFPDTTLAQLLSKDFYGSQQSLIKSGFSSR